MHTALFIVSLFPDGRRLIQPALFRSAGRPSALEKVLRRSTYRFQPPGTSEKKASMESAVQEEQGTLPELQPPAFSYGSAFPF